jgi:REP element-mobilizing transposase RayT
MMPRQVRIQFPGAVYHVMARGDRREDIFRDDIDRNMFLAVLEEACGKTHWRCHAYVLMPNHYHLVLETPEANLVPGMAWLQNTYTRRHNVRHKLWGHLFGGRYKAVLVDPDDALYLPTLIDYVHLNPVRAGLVPVEDGLESFPWSSLRWYAVAAEKRPAWVMVERGLRMRGCEDVAEGRKRYLEHLDRRVREEGEQAGRTLPAGQSLQSTLRRGWVFGTEEFKERMLAMGETLLRLRSRSADFSSGPAVKEHQKVDAEGLVKRGMEQLGMTEEDLLALARSEGRKVLIAAAVRSVTTVPLEWIVQRLSMGSRSTVSREVRTIGRRMEGDAALREEYERLLIPAVPRATEESPMKNDVADPNN